MTTKFLHLVCCLILISVISSESEDYYWRHFNGTIPDDALIGSTNFGYNQYIGRGPVNASLGSGIFVGAIIPGTKNILIPTGGEIHIVTDYLEILCSDQGSNYSWVPANSSSVESTPGLFWGGYYVASLENLWIGRIKLNNEEYAIGHVNQFASNSFYYINDKGVYNLTTSNFEVLTTS